MLIFQKEKKEEEKKKKVRTKCTACCFYAKEQAVLFSGDTLFQGSAGRTDFPGGSWESLISSVHTKLLVLPDETKVFPGHGPASTIGQERRNNPFFRN